MTAPIRICRDCKHSSWAQAWKSFRDVGLDPRHWMEKAALNAPPTQCLHPSVETIDLVTGQRRHPPATFMRETPGRCGVGGALWEAADDASTG